MESSSDSSRGPSPAPKQTKFAVFWDMENCKVPKGCKASTISDRIQKVIRRQDLTATVTIKAYSTVRIVPKAVQKDLHHAAIRLVHIPGRKKNAADITIMVDMFAFAYRNRRNSRMFLITGDGDFSEAIKQFGLLNHPVFFICPKQPSHELFNAATKVWFWPHVAWGKSFDPVSTLNDLRLLAQQDNTTYVNYGDMKCNNLSRPIRNVNPININQETDHRYQRYEQAAVTDSDYMPPSKRARLSHGDSPKSNAKCGTEFGRQKSKDRLIVDKPRSQIRSHSGDSGRTNSQDGTEFGRQASKADSATRPHITAQKEKSDIGDKSCSQRVKPSHGDAARSQRVTSSHRDSPKLNGKCENEFGRQKSKDIGITDKPRSQIRSSNRNSGRTNARDGTEFDRHTLEANRGINDRLHISEQKDIGDQSRSQGVASRHGDSPRRNGKCVTESQRQQLKDNDIKDKPRSQIRSINRYSGSTNSKD